MRIKIKDEMDDIRLKVSYKELMIIKLALKNYNFEEVSKEDFNFINFDKDEIDNESELITLADELTEKIDKKTKNIHVW